MSKTSNFGKLSLSALALAAAGAAPGRPIAPPAAPAPAAQAANKLATSADLGGAARFLTFIETDKPVYRANEKVYVRAVLLNAATHVPLGDDQNVQAEVQILGPRGEVVSSGNAASEKSVVAFGWTVPESTSGGEYTFKIKYPFAGHAPAERKFDVRVYRAPRLKSQVKFVRDGYGPGEKVTASLHTERAEGGFPAGAKVTVIARVDGRQVFTGPASVDAKGDCTATFELPKAMERGEGTLAFAIEDGGTVETASKTIPILLQTLDLNIYPEGGDAVAGWSNRFYFEAKTPAQKPADFKGAIFDSKGNKVADVVTEHEGRGRFVAPQAAGETYTLKVLEPAGITKTWTLPAPKVGGVVLKTGEDVVGKGKEVNVTVMGRGAAKVTLMKRETIVAEADMKTAKSDEAGVYSINLKPKGDEDGVLTVTAWDADGKPIAERLVYRQPAKEIKVSVKADQSTYTPGGKVKLDINTTDENGKGIPAIVGLTVTDDTVLEMIEKREQAPRLPVMVMFEGEVKELADAHIYMDSTNPKAALATDLLLGTQGWRRFALMNPTEFMAKHGDDAKRVLAFTKPEPPRPEMMAMRAMAMDMGAAVPEAAMAGPQIEKAALPPAMPARDGDERALELRDNKAKQGEREADGQAGNQADQPQLKMRADAQGLVAEQGLAMDVAPGGGRGGRGGGRRGQGFARQMQDPGSLLMVRQYAHELRPNWSPTDRSDFAETVYWNANLTTDAAGHASATFNLSDSVTTFRTFADAFDKTGALGSSASTLNAVQPFFIEPKIPLEVSAGDIITLMIAAVNNTNGPLEKFEISVTAPDGLQVSLPAGNYPGGLPANDRARRRFAINVGDKTGDFDLTINATAGQFVDRVTRKLRVKPKGFPTKLAYGGLLDSSTPAKKEFTVPPSMVANSMQTFATVYPSPMANLTDAVAALLQEPGGCFEQTSSVNYPMAMAQMYFRTHQGVDPKLQAKATDLLTRGYQKLIAFECKDKGYEWFGGTVPGHEALTAYGLMEFHDMQQGGLALVDDKMLDRTRTWILSRRDGSGGFMRNEKSLDSFGGAPALTTNAYIVWALLQTGEKGLEKEISTIREAAKTSEDSYVLALAANICELAKDQETAKLFMAKLAKKQAKTGGVDGGVTSITRSGGEALAIETTALASLAWQAQKEFAANAQASIKFLADSCKGGRFGSTQSTILALKAIVAYDQSQAHPKAPGKLTLIVDNKPFGEPLAFTEDSKGALTFPEFGSALPPGPHSVSVQMTDGSQMPFSLGVTFNSTTPATDAQCKLELFTVLKDAQLAEGGITEARVVVTNTTQKDAASPVAIVGIPGGLEVRHDQLKELVKAGKIDAYEVNGREVVLYWRQLKAGVKADVSLSLTAAVPGAYTAPASRVYEYYTDEFKQWTEGTKVTISPK